MSAFPKKRAKEKTPQQILFLATAYSKIMDGIALGNGFDVLKQEVELYQVNENIYAISKKQSFDSYWGEIVSLTEGEES